jgi:hypothetical protein
MFFPTTFIVALLAVVTPAFSVPIPDVLNGIVTRSEAASLEARGLDLDLPMEMVKRDDEFYQNLAARDGEFYEELMARAPEPEMKALHRRPVLGDANRASNSQYRKRSSKIGNFFKKIGAGASIVALHPCDFC